MKTEVTRALGAIAAVMCLVAVGAHADDSDATIMDIERALWAAWAQGDPGPFDMHVTDDAVNVVPSGITIGKAELIKWIESGSCDVAGYSVGDMQVVHPADNVAIVVYSADQDAVCDGAPLAAHIHVSSIYVKTDGGWMSAAYSETPAAQ